ncbi:hypothetical protein CASFOL_002886 [Castilleja foliolosa]|uniref:BZIP domain-containing protein n=1 Tax=Castilleja foliolosa TaxID=1961234 RepID=A0ABD3EFK0_9LAMI
MEMRTPLQHRLSSLSLTLDRAIEHEFKHGCTLDPNMDTRKLRRTISNRLSAKRSRIKKIQYINGMEQMVNDLEELISVIRTQIDSYKERTTLLLMQNDSLQKLVEFRANESKLSEIELERKQAEVCRLRELESTMNNYDKGGSSNPSYGCYQNGIQHLQKPTYVQLGLKIEPNSEFEQHGNDHQAGFRFKLPIEMVAAAKNEDEAEIDQYINFEQLNADQASASE